MNILNFTRDEIKAMSDSGMMNKKSPLHYDVCKEISNGVPYSQIADKFNFAEVKLVSYIKEKKCPDCR